MLALVVDRRTGNISLMEPEQIRMSHVGMLDPQAVQKIEMLQRGEHVLIGHYVVAHAPHGITPRELAAR